MPWSYGPERAEAIRLLQEQLNRARSRLQSLAATADAEETSYHLRDGADIEHGELRRESAAMQDALDRLGSAGDGSLQDEIRLLEESLKILRRDVET